MLHFLFVLATVLLVTPTFAQFDTYRLPNNTRPETYDISIRTWNFANNATFTGSVRIGIVTLEPTDYIRLHHNVQRLESVRVLSVDGIPINIGDYSYNSEYDFLTIPIVGNPLPQGTRYFVEIDYVSLMNMYSGLYRGFYIVDDELVWFGSTHFQAIHARSAFPCYDELALKSNFTIRITHESMYSAISNMPVVSETPNTDGSVTTLFETSPLMSTYLVAFHISEFPHITSSEPQPIPQRFFSRSTAVGLTDVALDAGERLMEAYSDFIDIEYPLPKMDQVAVPGFPTGAMENFGLVTYDEFYALYNETEDFFAKRIYAVQTVAHELAHQWFGNLVTPSWWTFIWMKEGFATFFEYLGLDLVHPDWQMMNYFVNDVTHYIFRIDSSEFTQPMTQYVENPLEIDFHFNSIAYSKAAAVLRMFYYMFGETTFMRGVKTYLENNAYSDADEEDLFDALDEAVRSDGQIVLPESVSTIMGTWTRQASFPLISVERNYEGAGVNQVTLRQERYYSFPPTDREDTKWWVPYNVMIPSNPGANETLTVEGWIPQNSSSLEITVDSLDADDYLVINKRAAGYYRVIYDERNYRLISDAMVRNIHDFHPTNVAQLLSDAVEFYERGHLNITTILHLLRGLEFEANYNSWNPAFDFLFYVSRNFLGHWNYWIWADFVRSITEHLYDTVGVVDIPDEPFRNKMARESVVSLACQMGSVHCRSDATRQLRRYLETGEEFHQNLRHVLMCASMRSASRSEFNAVWDRLKVLPREDFMGRSAFIQMMGCSTSPPLLRQYVSSIFDLTIWSVFEQYTVVESILRNGLDTGVDVALDFFIDNPLQIVEAFSIWFIQDLAFYIRSNQQIEKFVELQTILLEAGLLEQAAFDFNMRIVDDSRSWSVAQGGVVSDWLLENFV